MDKKEVLRIKREIAREVAGELEPDGQIYTHLSYVHGDHDEEFEEALSQVRHALEYIAEPPMRISQKKREAWLAERRAKKEGKSNVSS